MIRLGRWYLTTAIAFALAVPLACDGDKPLPGEPGTAVPGTLVLSLTTPNTDDGAILFSLSGGEMDAFSAATASNQLFFRVPDGTSVNAVLVGDISQGALMALEVPDVEKAASYSATVSQIADRNSDLRADLSGYVLTVSVQ